MFNQPSIKIQYQAYPNSRKIEAFGQKYAFATIPVYPSESFHVSCVFRIRYQNNISKEISQQISLLNKYFKISLISSSLQKDIYFRSRFKFRQN